MSHPLARLARRSVEAALLPARVTADVLAVDEGAQADAGSDPEGQQPSRDDVASTGEWVGETRAEAEAIVAHVAEQVSEAWDGVNGAVGEVAEQLGEWVEDHTAPVSHVVEEAEGLIEDGLGTHRRIWSDADAGADPGAVEHAQVEHAQIEVRGIEQPFARGLRRRLRGALEQVEGVHWAEVNAITGRVAVAFDATSPVSALVSVVEGVEQAYGVRRLRLDEPGETVAWDAPDRAEHPADVEPIHRAVAVLAGNTVGLGYTVVGRLLRLPRVPVEVAAIASVVDHNPWLRRRVTRLLGRRASELVVPLATAAGGAAAQGPLGILVDLGYQSLRLTELRSRKAVWDQREPELYAQPARAPIEPPDLAPRPVPLPRGPVERVAQTVSLASLAGFAVTLIVTRRPGFAADAFLAGLPKAARLGREGFACQLGRTLAARGVVPLDGAALRRLDRVDTVVIDSATLVTGHTALGDVHPLGDVDADTARERAEALLDGAEPTAVRRAGAWLLRSVDDVAGDLPSATHARIRQLRDAGQEPLALLADGAVVAVVGARAELDPGASPVIDAVRACGHRLVVAGDRGHAGALVGADAQVARGKPMGPAIRGLQAEGAVVMVISRRGKTGQAAADVGVGLTRETGRPPWGCDLILGRELAEATTLVTATRSAAQVSARAAWFAAAGSGLGALLALTGPRTAAGSRCLAAVNGAAAAALLSGTWSAVELARQPVPRGHRPPAWHALAPAEVLDRLTSSRQGLSDATARQRRRIQRGSEAEIGAAEPFLAELANPLNPVLGVGAAMSAAVGSMLDAGLVLGLIGINTAIGGIQRLRADRAVAHLLARTSQPVRVVRDHAERAVAEDELVAGDVIRLWAGEAVPGDCRVLAAEGLEVDESSLTGESLPVPKHPDPTPEAAVPDRACMLYEGSSVAAGTVTAVVVATGADTELARAAAQTPAAADSGVERRLAELTRRIVPGAGVAAGAVAVAGLARGWPWREIAGTGVSLAVAAVPEGLPFLASAGQLAGARRLADRGAVVPNPRAIEALGRVDVLCVDKTGTVTEGVMRLRAVSDGERVAEIAELGDAQRAVLGAACRATAAAGDGAEPEEAELDQELDEAELDQTERGLLAGARAAGMAATAGVGQWEPIADLPFEASRGLSAVLGRVGESQHLVAKGAPESVLPLCARRRRPDGAAADLDAADRDALAAHADALAARGYRVLAVAGRDASAATERLEQRSGGRTSGEVDLDRVDDLELVGFVALADPVRDTAAEALAGIARAGVAPVLVTGDHPHTARAVATELGLNGDGGVVTGAEVDALDDAALDARVTDAAVFARVTPAQKVRIVEALRRRGRVVAMTGDGANDAAAIRAADVGVALGHRATAAAREAADVVVVDDRVETLIDALVEGRALWGSVREALSVLVGGNLGEIGFTVATSLVSRSAPMSARQFLLVNLFTDLAPALAIAVRRPLDTTPERLLREGPDASLGAALNRDIAVRATATTIAATGAWLLARPSGTAARASTVALVALVGAQLGQTVAAGGARQPLVLAAGAGSAALLAGVVQTPGISGFFGCRPLGPLGWSQAIGSAAVATAGAQGAQWWLARRAAVRAG